MKHNILVLLAALSLGSCASYDAINKERPINPVIHFGVGALTAGTVKYYMNKQGHEPWKANAAGIAAAALVGGAIELYDIRVDKFDVGDWLGYVVGGITVTFAF